VNALDKVVKQLREGDTRRWCSRASAARVTPSVRKSQADEIKQRLLAESRHERLEHPGSVAFARQLAPRA